MKSVLAIVTILFMLGFVVFAGGRGHSYASFQSYPSFYSMPFRQGFVSIQASSHSQAPVFVSMPMHTSFAMAGFMPSFSQNRISFTFVDP